MKVRHMELHGYIVIVILLGMLFFVSAVYAFCWSIKKGQMRKLEDASRSIFTSEEPEGVETDFFPGEAGQHFKSRK